MPRKLSEAYRPHHHHHPHHHPHHHHRRHHRRRPRPRCCRWCCSSSVTPRPRPGSSRRRAAPSVTRTHYLHTLALPRYASEGRRRRERLCCTHHPHQSHHTHSPHPHRRYLRCTVATCCTRSERSSGLWTRVPPLRVVSARFVSVELPAPACIDSANLCEPAPCFPSCVPACSR